MRRSLACAAALVALAGCGGGADERPNPPDPRPRADPAPADPGPIAAGDVAVHLRALEGIARDSGGNRAAGTAGEERTAAYVAERLREAGWRVRRQAVTFPVFEDRRPPVLGDLRRGRDFVVAEYSGSGTLRGRPRPFDTEACEAAALGDLSGGDVAIVARGTCTFREKALNAQRAGAGGLVVVDDEEDEPVAATLGDPRGIEIPVLAATGPAAQRLARAAAPVEVDVATVSENRTAHNVLAETAPADRVVMAGAHLDSVEAGPGINDDGSGIAALLEIAARQRDRPGLRLGFWAAEELGLFGSRHYVDELDRSERERIAAYVNLDMVGTEGGDVEVYDTDDRVERVLREAVDEDGEEDLGGDSDHAPFERAGIPIGGIFTGVDRCYHRRCDTVSRTDARLVAEIAEDVRGALADLAG